MFMKRSVITTAMFMASSVFASAILSSPWFPFEDTLIHVERAKDVVIAECLSDTGPAINCLAPCEVKVLAVIKGDRRIGKLVLYSDGLKSGRTYMLTNFGTYTDDINFATNGELAAVELPPDFDFGLLKGKSPVEQVRSVFDARRSWVERELEKLGLEKKLLEKATPKMVK
jgi:hypothetical protein